MLRSLGVQQNARIDKPSDTTEHEAERSAKAFASGDSVAGNSTATTHAREGVARKLAPSNVSPSTLTGASSSGQPLPTSVRRDYERFFEADLSGVRVHTSERAANTAAAVGARAFTYGPHLVFGNGEYRPHSKEGRRLIAHETAHALQQHVQLGPGARGPNHAGGIQTRAPLHIARQEVEGEQTADAIREPILDELRRHDSLEFLRRLRALDLSGQALLLGDTAFLGEVHQHLRGNDYWIVVLILRYGDRPPPDYVRQLQQAADQRDIRRIRDLLRAFPELRAPHIVPGVRQMLDETFEGFPDRGEILNIFDQRETGRYTEDSRHAGVHYERPEGGGAFVLEAHGGETRYSLSRTASEVRVVVRIQLVRRADPAQPFYADDTLLQVWRTGIEHNWNNRFVITNDATHLPLLFVPVFTEASPHHVVEVDESEEYVRSRIHMWWGRASPRTVAHEFGHLIGNVDEYQLPGSMSDIGPEHNLSVDEMLRSSYEGITGEVPPPSAEGHSLPGIMGEGLGALDRHVTPIVAVFNARLLRPGETPFRLE